VRQLFGFAMRLAFVVVSSYEKNGQLALVPSAVVDGDLVARRLAHLDARFAVHRFAAERDLPEELERFLANCPEPVSELLLYFSGYAVLSSERGAALLLDGARPSAFSVRRLRKILEQSAQAACLIVDAAVIVDAGQSLSEVAREIGHTLTAGSSAVSALVAARASDAPDAFGGSAFTGLLLTALDWLGTTRAANQPVNVRWLFDGLRADAVTWSEIPHAELLVEAATFAILPAAPAASQPAPAPKPPSLPPKPAPLVAKPATLPPPPPRASVGPPPLPKRSVPPPSALPARPTAEGVIAVDPAAALEILVASKPTDVDLRERLVDVYLQKGDADRALSQCRKLARLAPSRAITFKRVRALFDRAGAKDGVYAASSVLQYLGEVDAEVTELLSQHRTGGLLAVRGTLTDGDWRDSLIVNDEDPYLPRLLEALAPFAVSVGVGLAKHKKRWFEPDPTTLEDLEKSTTMLAKTLGWTARVLAVTPPSLYISSDQNAWLDVAPTEHPSVLAGRGLGSGLGLPELAFLLGRHLARFRPELRLFSYFATPTELASLVTAAALLGGTPGIDARKVDADAKRLHAALRREIRDDDLDRLKRIAGDFPLFEIEERAKRAIVAAECSFARAGLVACGDVASAADLVKRFPTGGLATVDEQLGELFAFAIGDAYAALRARLGVAIV
jgi:hypothetical protein